MGQRAARRVEHFSPALRAEFDRLHGLSNSAEWCQCVAWWVEGWESFGGRSADENRRLRDRLCAAGEYDGYLLLEGRTALARAQVGPRHRLTKLASEYGLAPDPTDWAITCLLVALAHRGRGCARELLAGILADLDAC